MLHDTTEFDDHSLSARLLRSFVWLGIFAAAAVFWAAVGVLVFSLLA